MPKRFLILLLACGAGSVLATTQFFKPNREARLVVSLRTKATYPAGDPVVVTVMLSNQSAEPILINSRMLFNRYPLPGEVSFNIQGPNKQDYPLKKVIIPQELKPDELTVLRKDDTMEREVDLKEFYGVRKSGKYKVQVIYYNNVELEKDGLQTWRGSLASEPTVITLQ